MSLRQRKPRIHDEQHLDFIRSLPCVVCGNDIETEAAHLRATNRKYGKAYTGKQEKPSDIWTLPLCGKCHREQHRANEKNFWSNQGINPWVLALSLYASNPDRELAQDVIDSQAQRTASRPLERRS